MTEAGIANGLIAGGIAADVIHQALTQGEYTSGFMSQYQRRWFANDRYKILLLQYRLTQLFLPLSHFDRNMFAKLMQVLFLGGRLNRRQKLQMLTYPLLPAPRQQDALFRHRSDGGTESTASWQE
jgi:flavin-dependent dehydrogenase